MSGNFYLPSMSARRPVIRGSNGDIPTPYQSPRYGMPKIRDTFNEPAFKQCCNNRRQYVEDIYDACRDATRTGVTDGSTWTTPPKEKTQKRPTRTGSTPKASEEDARRAGIPPGYSYKNWDPAEEPIMLLGSVFDANSLGKWIYDWTVFYNGPDTPLAEMAGELWLLLIQLGGKVKRAQEKIRKIRRKENAEMVEDFLMSGERLWIRFAKLLKTCERFMWKAAKKENGDKMPVTLGKNSGREFVESIFGRDRELEKTEQLMTGMRLWTMRFDANCEDILRCSHA